MAACIIHLLIVRLRLCRRTANRACTGGYVTVDTDATSHSPAVGGDVQWERVNTIPLLIKNEKNELLSLSNALLSVTLRWLRRHAVSAALAWQSHLPCRPGHAYRSGDQRRRWPPTAPVGIDDPSATPASTPGDASPATRPPDGKKHAPQPPRDVPLTAAGACKRGTLAGSRAVSV